MSLCWRPIVQRVTSLTLKLSPEGAFKISHLRTLVTINNSLKHPSKKKVPDLAVRKSNSSRYLHLLPSEHDKNKRSGILKSNPRRRDWYNAHTLIERIICEKGDEKWLDDDWIRLSEELSELVTGSWETICMVLFYNTSNLAFGKSLMDYVVFSRSEEPSLIFITYFIGLLGKTSNGDVAQEEKMKHYYDDLISKHEVLDSFTMEILIKGLCYTKYYTECLTLLKRARETNVLSTVILVNIFIGGLRNENHELCTHILSHFDDPESAGSYFDSSIFFNRVDLIVDEALKCGNKDGVKLFFSFLEKHGLLPKKDKVSEIMDIFKRYEPGKWSGKFGQVHHITGRCSVCRNVMEKISITDEEFKSLQSAFLDQVIVNDNIFYKSSPHEVQSFIKFVDRNGPFDVVIDGLNVLFSSDSKRRKHPEAYFLSLIESYFTKQGLNVLILGSKFLNTVKDIGHKSSIFTTTTTRADDAFFLYAALHSGKDTLIVSADKLRDHKNSLEPRLRPIFHRWLKSTQVIDFYVNNTTHKMVLRYRKYNLGPVEDKGGWHLPFDDVTEHQPFGRNGVLCLRHGPENFSCSKKLNDRNKRNV